jgi:hypothetical protein
MTCARQQHQQQQQAASTPCLVSWHSNRCLSPYFVRRFPLLQHETLLRQVSMHFRVGALQGESRRSGRVAT